MVIFGIPLTIHSNNGHEFANAIFRGLCNILAIQYSNSVPRYSQSNGLVERRRRDILQNLRRPPIDFDDYDNWSSSIRLVELLTNASPHAATGDTPYELMFGSASFTKSDDSCIVQAIDSVESKCTFLQEYKLKLDRINQKREEAKANQISSELIIRSFVYCRMVGRRNHVNFLRFNYE
ncbi:hypothetical protein RCL1_004260 [Eukaryota sp. TZLM3-RCL]